jgi:hypothetical protein
MSNLQVALQNVQIPEKLNDAANVQEPQPTRVSAEADHTPESKKQASGESSEEMPSPPAPMAGASTPEQTGEGNIVPGQNSSGKKTRYKGKGVDANGRPRNFYNPPGKVLRSLANQSYYDSFYGNQGQIYTLKQKYKTQLCKHYLENESCPLHQFCQFAHGNQELRQAQDVSDQ